MIKRIDFKRALWVCCAVVTGVLSGHAQSLTDSLSHHRFVTRAASVGVGGANVYDTYLSPREYSGTELNVAYEGFRSTRFSNRLYVQHLLQGSYVYGEKRKTESGNMYAAMLEWDWTWLYQWSPLRGLHVYAGGGTDLQGGGLYNKRNSNNPAQAKVALQLEASGMCTYRLTAIRKFPLELRYQCAVPFVGVQFTPEYHESYYEMFLEKSYGSKNWCATSFGNAPSFRHRFTIDIPLWGQRFQVGFQGNYRQSRLQGLRYHHYSNTFFIGYVQHLYRIREKDVLRRQFNY